MGTLTRLDQLSYVAALLLKKRRSKLVKFSRLIENGIIMESFQLPDELDLSLLKLRLGFLIFRQFNNIITLMHGNKTKSICTEIRPNFESQFAPQ